MESVGATQCATHIVVSIVATFSRAVGIHAHDVLPNLALQWRWGCVLRALPRIRTIPVISWAATLDSSVTITTYKAPFRVFTDGNLADGDRLLLRRIDNPKAAIKPALGVILMAQATKL
jgi:hypothetical protein